MKIDKTDIQRTIAINEVVYNAAGYYLWLKNNGHADITEVEVEEEKVQIRWSLYAYEQEIDNGVYSFPTECLYAEDWKKALEDLVKQEDG